MGRIPNFVLKRGNLILLDLPKIFVFRAGPRIFRIGKIKQLGNFCAYGAGAHYCIIYLPINARLFWMNEDKFVAKCCFFVYGYSRNHSRVVLCFQRSRSAVYRPSLQFRDGRSFAELIG
ncbi:84934ef7-4bb0-4b94-bae6-5c415fde6581 [Sclerotinia trifoliorum]|uniref:84934ef7-4bb0-4b94-bae6-5c415fde6581 n=1 Tax=Sclerotinia trifoliorum TaxID=28548 RepID=A0A8H2VSR8_9HELO|nr:84934ef7-4bb0-4b94-bae6-5c415fde6581 [Sclerotinia trifoliorum]